MAQASPARPASSKKDAEPHGLAYTLAAVALLLCLMALGAAYGFSAWYAAATAPARTQTGAAPIAKTIGGQRYAFPAEAIARPSQRAPGAADRVDLDLRLGGDAGRTISVAIVPRAEAIASAQLLDAVYLHQFSNAERDGVPGLIGKPLQASSGYRDETVWYDPIAMNPFVAKCGRTIAPQAPRPSCMRVALLADHNLAIVKFPQARLADWRGMDAALEAAIAPMRL